MTIHGMMPGLIHLATTTLPPEKAAARRGMGLLAIVVLTTFGILFLLALVITIRRGRKARTEAAYRPAAKPIAQPDAWAEAGRRANPDDGDEFIAGYETGEFDPTDPNTDPRD